MKICKYNNTKLLEYDQIIKTKPQSINQLMITKINEKGIENNEIKDKEIKDNTKNKDSTINIENKGTKLHTKIEEISNHSDAISLIEKLSTLKDVTNKASNLPFVTNWFHIDYIHEIERKALPEFFTNDISQKTDQLYKQFRNSIVCLYRKNPKNYLSSNGCRQYVCGDILSIMRIHGFLEKWGIINLDMDTGKKLSNPLM